MALLEVTDLTTRFKTDDGIVKAVSQVSFGLDRGNTLGVVGESGSGKSVTFLTVMGLLDPRHAQMTGSVLFDGKEILGVGSARLRSIRGKRIGMIFQDPMTSLNPVKRIGWQLEEAVLLHNDVTHAEARRRSIEILKEVEIPRAEDRVDDYPHQFSGGMRQRVMIAMALINKPEIIIADEPTTALDVTTQAQILRLMKQLQDEHQMAIRRKSTIFSRSRRCPIPGACSARCHASTPTRSAWSRFRVSRRRSSSRLVAARSARAAPTCSTAAARSCPSSGRRRTATGTASAATSRRRIACGSGRRRRPP
jgi:ABC-type dipeptide/oligopeptide/nickel transport system ATPase subunit